MSDKELRARVAEYMAQRAVLSLATFGSQRPWSSPVFYVHDAALNLFFLSDPDSRHGLNLAADPRAAGSITEDYHDWQDIRGIQLEGIVERLGGPEAGQARALYVAKFPSAVPFLDPSSPLFPKAGGRASIYRLTPERLSMTDNTRGFGRREWLEGF